MRLRRAAGLAPVAAFVLAAGLPAGAAAAPCSATQWVGVWSAPPTDASRGTGNIGDNVDGSFNQKTSARNDTTRAVLTPTYGGNTVRVHLSNRFGGQSVTFGHVTIALRRAGAEIAPGTARELLFGGKRSVTVKPGQDVVSDPVGFVFNAFEGLAVDVHVPGDAGKPTEHFSARQTSFITPDGTGDRTGEASGASFTEKTTGRPWVTGVDALAPAGTGAIVALGDSVTDGYNGAPIGVPETQDGIDADGRWTDVLARRLRAANRRLSVLNQGITGNKVLVDVSPVYNWSALRRLPLDVLQQAGATTVIWMEGLNDIGQKPSAGVPDLIAGWQQGIARMHATGLRVLMGTLPPTGSADTRPDAMEDKRRRLNTWIRANSAADGVIDFDAALRDPKLPNRVDPKYQGSDFLHLNLEGNRAMGDAVPLGMLHEPACGAPIGVRVTPKRLTAGRRTTLRVLVHREGRPFRGAVARMAGREATTGADGVARLRVRIRRAGRVSLRVTAPDAAPRTLHLTVRRARR